MEEMGGTGLQECHRRSPISHTKGIDSSPFDHPSILIKDRFMGTAKIV